MYNFGPTTSRSLTSSTGLPSRAGSPTTKKRKKKTSKRKKK